MKRIDLNGFTPEELAGHTSKGDQPKWQVEGIWYKADHMGGESLSEILISKLLKYSNLTDFIDYTPVIIAYDDQDHRGCASRNFRRQDEILVPYEKLHRAYKGIGLASQIAKYPETTDRIRYTVDFIEEVTGLHGVGAYLTGVLELDAFFLNEDRHTNNLAVIRNEKTEEYRPCPIFDNGLSLLSDWNDYPLESDLYECIARVKAKPFSVKFDEQIECAEILYGSHLKFRFKKSDVREILKTMEGFYPPQVLSRTERILYEQMRRYPIFF